MAAAVPVAIATGTVPGVVAALGSAATAVGAARHIFGFDRNWTARAVTAERIKGRAVLFTLGLMDAPRLVTDVTELVDRETAGWSHAVRAALGTGTEPPPLAATSDGMTRGGFARGAAAPLSVAETIPDKKDYDNFMSKGSALR